MAEQTIRCPLCRREFPLSEALSEELRETMRAEMTEQSKQVADELAEKERSLAAREKGLQKEVDETLKAERANLEKALRQQAEERVTVELRDLRQQVAEKAQQLGEVQKAELELRKQQRRLEEDRKAFELKMTRALDSEREKLRQEVLKQAVEEHQLKDKEKDKQLADLRREIDELKRKAHRGSPQTQGEVLELDMEASLRQQFPSDKVEAVATGARGADVILNVYHAAAFCGRLMLEVKNTRAWSNGWLKKIKEDQGPAKADIAMVVSTALPKGIENFGVVDGIWVTSRPCAVGLVAALRENLVQVAAIKRSEEGKDGKAETLYNYLRSPEFIRRVRATADALKGLWANLAHERMSLEKLWAEREQQIVQAVTGFGSLYGRINGIVATLPKVEAFDLKALPPGKKAD